MTARDASGNTIHGRTLICEGMERAGIVWYFAAKPAVICGACLVLLEGLITVFDTVK